jgi:hypothetical protein
MLKQLRLFADLEEIVLFQHMWFQTLIAAIPETAAAITAAN